MVDWAGETEGFEGKTIGMFAITPDKVQPFADLMKNGMPPQRTKPPAQVSLPASYCDFNEHRASH